jgi:hypothetical protein
MTLLTATLLYCDVDLDDFNRDVEMSVLDWATGNGIIDVVDWDKVQGEIKVEEVA